MIWFICFMAVVGALYIGAPSPEYRGCNSVRARNQYLTAYARGYILFLFVWIKRDLSESKLNQVRQNQMKVCKDIGVWNDMDDGFCRAWGKK